MTSSKNTANGGEKPRTYSLSTIAESEFPWATAVVAHARDMAAVQRGDRHAKRQFVFSEPFLIGKFGATADEVRSLPEPTAASEAATQRLIEQWDAQDWQAARSGGGADERPRIWAALDLEASAPLDWLARDRIPTASVTLLVGDEQLGKSLFWVWVASFVTTGKPCPEWGIPARDPGYVVIVATEDDWTGVLRPRLEVAAVDLAYVKVVCADKDGTGAPTFPAHLDVLDGLDVDPALLVVDAWVDTLAAGTKVSDPQQARLALHPWKEYAARTRAAVVLLTHTNRVATANARDKYGLTSELRKKARMTLFAQKDENPDCVLIGPEKTNLTGELPADRFRRTVVQHFEPTDSSSGTVAKLEYVESSGMTSKKLIEQNFYGRDDENDDDDSDLTEAVNWLTDYLESEGRTPSRIVKSEAKADGIAERTLKRAAKKLRDAHVLDYVSEGARRTTSWELIGGTPVDPHGKPLIAGEP